MENDEIKKLIKARNRTKVILSVIVVLIILAEVLRFFFDKS